MANIAQTINVLQSLILTEGKEMILTPTYHVFDMYQVHQDALMLPVHVESQPLSLGFTSIPAVSASASEDENRKIHVSLTNIDPKNEQVVELDIRGVSPKYSSGKIITSDDICDHNTFENGEKVRVQEYNGKVSSTNGRIQVVVPAKSVITICLA
jgi:alpha-N-arabinofuranosidase